jgi:hypothetical protein
MLRVVALYNSKPVMVRVLYATLFASYLATLGLLLRAQLFISGQLIYSLSPNTTLLIQRPRISRVLRNNWNLCYR